MKLGTAEAKHLNWINFLGKLRVKNCGKAILDITNSVDIFYLGGKGILEINVDAFFHFFTDLSVLFNTVHW